MSEVLLVILLLLVTFSLYARDFTIQQQHDGVRQYMPEKPLYQQPFDEIKIPVLPPVTESNELSSKKSLPIKKIILSGHTIFSDQQLAEVYQNYLGRVVTIEELLVLKQKLTLYYVNHGYHNSGAVIPDQTVLDGLLKINIIEGQLNQIKIAGKTRLKQSYIAKRLRLGNEQVLNMNQLKKQVQLLHQNRLVDRVNAKLVPGLKPGESILNVSIEESLPYDLGILFNNRRSPGVGGLYGEVYGTVHNLTGYGDVLSARYGFTEGSDNVSIAFGAPLNKYDTRFSLFYNRSHADIIEEPFRELQIRSESENYGFSLSHPFYQTPQQVFLASISLEKRRSATRPAFAASIGSHNGISEVTALRLAQSWTRRYSKQVISLRSTFNIGLDWFGSTQNAGDVPDSDFFSWLGQFQWVRRLFDTNNSVVIRSYLQLSAVPLLSLEKFGVGGQLTVRGYRENTFIRDNAWVSSIEFRFPVFRLPIPRLSRDENDGMIALAIFYDFGWAKNNRFTDPNLVNVRQPQVAQTLSSIGIGIRWDPHKKIHSEIYWGYALRNMESQGEEDLRDVGVHFQMNAQFF